MTSSISDTIRRTAIERLEQITEFCSHRDGYSLYIHDLFYLYSLIASKSLSRFYDQFGHIEINLENVAMAKQFFKYAPVSQFEKECITTLSDYLNRRDRESKLLPMHYTGDKNYGMANQS